jgi:CTP synthase (UTP-ammonia lyase)
MTHPMARIALVGDRSANVRAHARIPALIDALLRRDGIALDAYWIATPDVAECDLGGFDAIWLVPGSPYDSADGAIAAVRTARERQIPFLGTCGGFQYALLEFARNVCRLPDVENAEVAPEAGEHLIVQLDCSLKGHEEAVMIVPGTLAAKLAGPGRRTERYHCDYGLDSAYLEPLSGAVCGSAASTTAGRLGSRNCPVTRFSLERSSSPSCTATAPSRTRSSSPWPSRQPSTPPRRPARPLPSARPRGF